MISKQPFARRIVIAFVLMTVLVSGVFSLGIVAVFHFVEESLVSDEMHRELESVLHEDLKYGRSPRLDAKTYFYASNLPDYAIPERYDSLAEGFTELVYGNEAFFAYTKVINDVRYALVQDQSEFEAHEKALYKVVFAGFIITVLGSWVLGRAMAGRVIAPLSRLAQQVKHRDQLLPSAPPLAPDYTDDEVGQLAQAFDSTLGKLRQSLEREQLFTSDVSHELRTPLMVIATSCELLEVAPVEEHQQVQLQRIMRATNDMRDLVQTFLQLARDTTDKSDFVSTETLAQVAERQSKQWGEPMKAKGIDFDCIVESNDHGQYNATFLGTVMTNLLRNALHYTNSGHVHLFLENGGFRVEDSGTGISPDQHESVFLPFVRGIHARGEGLGLGLSLVKRICTHQGWSITIHNLSPTGSCFRVRFEQGS